MKKKPGKLWFNFPLFGLEWGVWIATKEQIVKFEGEYCQGICYYNDRTILLASDMTHEQFRMTLAHEIQHAIEDHADVNYERGVKVDTHDRWTDQVARGWVYLMRHCPEILAFLQAKPSSLDKFKL